MEIIVNDTNILIDLYNAGLLPYCKRLDLDFRTLDVVLNEIEVREQLEAVEQLVGMALCVFIRCHLDRWPGSFKWFENMKVNAICHQRIFLLWCMQKTIIADF